MERTVAAYADRTPNPVSQCTVVEHERTRKDTYCSTSTQSRRTRRDVHLKVFDRLHMTRLWWFAASLTESPVAVPMLEERL